MYGSSKEKRIGKWKGDITFYWHSSFVMHWIYDTPCIDVASSLSFPMLVNVNYMWRNILLALILRSSLPLFLSSVELISVWIGYWWYWWINDYVTYMYILQSAALIVYIVTWYSYLSLLKRETLSWNSVFFRQGCFIYIAKKNK